MRKIQIQVADLMLEAELLDNDTADAIYNALPISASANLWGDEIYFSIPVSAEPAADAQEELAIGDLAYWPPGSAFCIFYGPTPVSRSGEPRAYSPANRFGRVTSDVSQLGGVAQGASVKVSKVA